MFASYPSYYRDSHVTTDFETVDFKPRQTTGQDFYDRSSLSRTVGLVGVGITALFGGLCVLGGYLIYRSQDSISSGIMVISLKSSWEKELLCLGLNLMVTACTEATGFAHGIALRSALASERRLHFNTNLRLLTAARGSAFNPNGTVCNVVMAILLIVSYSSSLLVTLSVNMGSSSDVPDAGFAICACEIPLIVLGVTLLVQAIIALTSIWNADILTWSSSPFDITAALVHHAHIIPESGRCMHGVGDNASRGPVAPSSKQPSAWRAHSNIRRVVITLFVLVVVCIAWGIVIIHFSDHNMSSALKSWSFFPQSQSHFVAYSIPITGGVYFYWALYYLNMACIQGPLTLALHCSELIVNVIRDERAWRKATREKGTTISSYPLVPVFAYPLNLALLLLKPVLHWMLGLAISLAGTAEGGYLTAIAVSMWPFQILNYAAGLLVFSLTLVAVSLYRPRGPQPAAYGHVQTLANLIDEWSPTMWWGDKGAGFSCRHAGTSDHSLPKVDMDTSYA